jgi:multisubunit Na+/H+ antiporter MnhG subunit
MYNHEAPSRQRGGWFQSRLTTWVLLGFLAVGAFFLFTEHTAHVLGLLPFAIFLLCPLMMYFMMRGMHGGHGGQNEHNREDGSRIPPEGGEQ